MVIIGLDATDFYTKLKIADTAHMAYLGLKRTGDAKSCLDSLCHGKEQLFCKKVEKLQNIQHIYGQLL